MSRSGIALLLIPALAGCGDRTALAADAPPFCQDLPVRDGHARVDSAGVEIVTNLHPATRDGAVRVDEAPAVSIGVVHGDEAYEFGRITNATRMGDGRIIVADGQAREIREFDDAGVLLARHGGSGSGPGEYRSIAAMLRGRGDTLWVVDAGNRRITKLGPDLSVAGSGPLPMIDWPAAPEGRLSGRTVVRLKGVLDDGTFIVANSLRGVRTEEVTNVSRDSLILRRMSADSEVGDSLGLILGIQLFEFFNDGVVTFGEAPLGYVESLAVGSDAFYYGAADRFEVREHGPDGTTRRLIRVCEPADPIPDELWEQVVNDRIAEFSEEARVYEGPALRGIPRATVAPAYLQLHVDERDRLWVRDFTRPDEPQRWKVISRDGLWLADVAMPGDMEVLEIGADYVLGRHTTDVNVHVVRLHHLTWP